MINLKKLFRRKKGQGALEYLFMIAAALIIIFVVVRYISQTGGQASQQSDIAALQSQAELAKTNLQAKGFWDNTYKVEVAPKSNGNGEVTGLQIMDDETPIATDSHLEYKSEYLSDDGDFVDDIKNFAGDSPTLEQLYDKCMDDNVKAACYVLIDLQDATKGEGS